MIKISNYICQDTISQRREKLIILSSKDQEYTDEINTENLVDFDSVKKPQITLLRICKTYRFQNQKGLFIEDIKRKFKKHETFNTSTID